MLKLIKAFFKLIKMLFKAMALFAGFVTALNAITCAIALFFGLKHEASRGNNIVKVSTDVNVVVYNAREISGGKALIKMMACATKDLADNPIIVIGDSFAELSKPSQEAILAHEEGHIVLGHIDTFSPLSQTLRTMYPYWGKVQPVELEADLYAARKTSTSQMIQALEEIKNTVSQSLSGAALKEVDIRIEALKKHL